MTPEFWAIVGAGALIYYTLVVTVRMLEERLNSIVRILINIEENTRGK